MNYLMRIEDIDALAEADVLEVSTNLVLKPGYELVIGSKEDMFWALVVEVKKLPDGSKHDWQATVVCDRMSELRKVLTYEVAQ